MSLLKRTMIAAAISAAFVVNANAGELNYNYLNVNYISNDIAIIGLNGTGFGVDGSFAVSENINIVVGYQSPSFTILGTSYPATELKLGAGFHSPVNDQGDWYAKGEYRSFEMSTAKASGFYLTGGLRAALSKDFEVDGYLGYGNLSGSGISASGMIFGVDGTYKVSDNFGVTVGYMSDKDAAGWSGFKFGARMYF